MTDETDDRLEEQPIPSDSKCPYCGADPTEESQAEHILSDMGYLHDDIRLQCSNDACGEDWVCGVPIGEPDDWGGDLWCSSCESRFGRVHRVSVNHVEDREKVRVHLKCPNDDCRYFWVVWREVGPKGVSLIGYPDITGETEGAEAYGYQEGSDGPDNEVSDCGNEYCIIHGQGTVGCPNANSGPT